MTKHGWVKNESIKAKCGGPLICNECQNEEFDLDAPKHPFDGQEWIAPLSQINWKFTRMGGWKKNALLDTIPGILSKPGHDILKPTAEDFVTRSHAIADSYISRLKDAKSFLEKAIDAFKIDIEASDLSEGMRTAISIELGQYLTTEGEKLNATDS